MRHPLRAYTDPLTCTLLTVMLPLSVTFKMKFLLITPCTKNTSLSEESWMRILTTYVLGSTT
jgi:hypothetical protein